MAAWSWMRAQCMCWFRGGSCSNRLVTTTRTFAPTRCLQGNTCHGVSFCLARLRPPKDKTRHSGGLAPTIPVNVRAIGALDRFGRTLLFTGVAGFVVDVALQLLRAYPEGCAFIGSLGWPIGRRCRFDAKRRTQSSSAFVVLALRSANSSSGSVGQSPRSSRSSFLMALTQSRPAIDRPRGTEVSLRQMRLPTRLQRPQPCPLPCEQTRGG